MLMNYHIGRLVLSSLCVGAFVAAGIWLVFGLQAEACKTNTNQIPAATKAPTHNELRIRRPMW